MKRSFRLTRSADFKRVRRIGKSYPHPLIVLVAAPNELATSRFAVVAGRGVGKAVTRNRAKRLIRAALDDLHLKILPGWDIILIARRSISESSYQQTVQALRSTFSRAHLLATCHD